MRTPVAVWALLFLALGTCCGAQRVPVIYSTDLFHPHGDPDDHYDLATLFAIEEFDIRGIILDFGERQKQGSGRPAIEQLMHITGRRVPYAIGLGRPLKSRDDKALGQPEEFQGGVRLILDALRKSRQKVILFSTGSCRDIAAAYNREPALFREKVRAYYFNVGNAPGEPQAEHNVNLDALSYQRAFEMDVPLFWCPCYGKDGYATHFVVDQPTVVGACTPRIQNFFVYCLTKSRSDPIAFLDSGPHPLPRGPRNMWCTAPFFHAAGRVVCELADGGFAALPPAEGQKAVTPYAFVPIRVTVADGKAAAARLDEPPPGKLAAAYWGCEHDKVGTRAPEPDGKPDCAVRLVGLEPKKAIANVVITGPRDGRWELVETGRWWRLAIERDGSRLDASFQFYAPGPHRIEVAYADATSQSADFQVPQIGGPALAFEFNPQEPNCHVFRATDRRYAQIMASCLQNLLAALTGG